MNKRDTKFIKKALFDSDDYNHLFIKLMLECWNHKTPHFGGAGPHRYDGNDSRCAYCGRPKNWKPKNPGYEASQILYGGDE